jgi:hypothetical protein
MRGVSSLLFSSLLMVSTGFAAEPPPTVAQLGAEIGLDADAIRRVLAGKLVESFPPETHPRDLAVGFVFLVKAPPREVAQAFRQRGDLGVDPNVLATHPITGAGAGDFDALRLSPHGVEEAKRYLDARPGDTLNLSDAEIAELHKLGPGAKVEQVEALLRRTLLARYTAYRASGLAGIAPYARANGTPRKPGDDLRRNTEQISRLLQKYVPSFEAVLSHYPQDRPANLDETFGWIVYNLDDRPTLTLRHRLTLAVGDGLVAADRELYVSQGYNAMQAVGALLPVEGGTMVFYGAHTSTDRVEGFASASKHSIGRRVMAKQLEKLFERSRDRFAK